MKHTYLVRGICTITVLAALLTGCSSGGSDTDYVSELAGTWKATTTDVYGTEKIIRNDTYTINADGTFSRIIVITDDYIDPSKADIYSSTTLTGTVSAGEDSITFATTQRYTSTTNMTTVPTTGGESFIDSSTISYFLKAKTIYLEVFTRKGSGSGIIGTWLKNSSSSHSSDGATLISDYEDTMTITANTITVVTKENQYFQGLSDLATQHSRSDNYDYTVVDGTTINVTESGHSTSTNWVYEISGDTLIIKGSKESYIKQ